MYTIDFNCKENRKNRYLVTAGTYWLIACLYIYSYEGVLSVVLQTNLKGKKSKKEIDECNSKR